jgi:glucokinase
MSHYAAIEIGGTKLQLVLGDETGAVRDRQKLTVDVARGAAGIRDQINTNLPPLIRGREVRAVGIGFGGPLDWETGVICNSHQVAGWSGFDMAGWVRALAGVPVVVDNDGNVAAFGEALAGAGKGLDPVFYVTLGSGVGGGLVKNGRIYHGAKPGEAEIGHVRLDRAGTTVESRCSGWAVDARLRQWSERNPDTFLGRLVRGHPGTEARHLATALAQGDTAARDLLREVAEDLAFGLSHVTHLFHPEVIILGGGLSKLGEVLRAEVEHRLASHIMEVFRPGPQMKLAVLGEDVVPCGALLLAHWRFLNGSVT